MDIPCEIDNLKTLKSGMKITLAVGDEHVQDVMKHIYNFMDKPLHVILSIDEQEQLERLNMINAEQRKKIYALFRDIGDYMGDDPESVKRQMKIQFIQNSEYEMFSLSNCSNQLARDFIEFIIQFCFRQGIALAEHPKDAFDDIEKYLRLCLDNRICSVCGKPTGKTPHHWDAIGAGRDRTKVDDSGLRKIALCNICHTEAHKIGRESFKKKHHVWGIIYP